ncbi:MAG TPA: succinylglutamate desuccinylase/aspartoacylase family protein [Saprospiraceae bacterium]|nr:succinylglutamate desuccinylase/aspartoacylase family protein [Saprospiraceae bacterium]HPN71760.1 succinylglutamate desuccinylase/aspartoacylase family protein [Saprospiraceae bacterium]
MALLDLPIKNDFSKPIIIERESFLPGDAGEVKIPVGRMPSDTRLYVNTYVFRSTEPGPTVLIMGGVHGDEINGIEIVSQLLQEEKFHTIKKGNVILIPLLNVYGFNNFSRDVPDGKDVNRSFPGVNSGSLAARVAGTLTKKVLPYVDFAIDLHTGGSSRYNYPQARFHSKLSPAFEMAKIFNAPYSINQPLISKSFRKVAKDLNIPAIVYEAGESVRLDGMSIEYGKRGIKRFLNHLDMLPYKDKKVVKSIIINATNWQRASQSGIFIWSKSSGDFINKGDELGVIKDPYGSKLTMVLSKFSGFIIGHNNASVVNHGDALFHIGIDYAHEGF